MADNSFEQKIVLKAVDQVTQTQKKILRETKRTFGEMQKQSKKTQTSLNSVKGGFIGIKTAVIGLGAFFTGRFTQSLIETETSLNRMERALKVATGSAENAQKEMSFLKVETSRLGLSFKETAISYGQLAAATRNTSLTTAQTRDIFLATAEAGSALGLSVDDMNGALRAMQQMVSKGNVQAEELRGQLGERIPGAFNMAAKAMGVSTKELNKLLETGQVTAADMLPKLAKEMRATFGKEAEEGARALQGQINSLGNAFFDLKKSILESGVGDLLVKAFESATSIAKDLNKQLDDYNAKQKDGKKITAETADELYKLLAGLHATAVADKNLTNATGKTVGEFIKLKNAIDGIMTAGYADNFLKKTNEEQLKAVVELKKYSQGLDEVEKKQKKLNDDAEKKRKSKLGQGSTTQAPTKFSPLFDMQATENENKKMLEAQKEAFTETIELQYEIEEMMIQAQQEGFDKQKALAELEYKKQTDVFINADKLKGDYAKASKMQLNKELGEIDKAQLEQEKKIGKRRVKLAHSITSNLIRAGELMLGTSKKNEGRRKALAVTQIGIDTAMGMMNAFAPPPQGAGALGGIPLSASIGILGATQAGAVLAAAKGADFTTNGPQLMLVGDNPGGRERVQVTPESSPNINGPKESTNNVSFGNISINMSGSGNPFDIMRSNPGEFFDEFERAAKRAGYEKVA